MKILEEKDELEVQPRSRDALDQPLGGDRGRNEVDERSEKIEDEDQNEEEEDKL